MPFCRYRLGGKGSSNDTKGFVCFCSNETIMVIPGEVTRHDDSKIFMGIRKGDRQIVNVVWSMHRV